MVLGFVLGVAGDVGGGGSFVGGVGVVGVGLEDHCVL